MQDLASRIRSARKTAKLGSRELDIRAGLAKGHTALMETRRRRDPYASTIAKLAKVLGVSTDWLLMGRRCPCDDVAG